MKALEVRALTKIYRTGVKALDNVSLEVQAGDFFALLGPNGAGKSTLIGILTSLVNKTSGLVKIFNHDIETDFSAAKSCIGIVPQEFNMNIFDTVMNTLIYQAGYYGIPLQQAKESSKYYIHQLDLWKKRNTIVNALSGGMKRRLMIARALVHQPRMLILDEPTAGVDIQTRRSMWSFLSEINNQGITIILTTHYLEEAENLCRNIAIIDEGRIVINTSMSSMLRQANKEIFIIYLQEPFKQLPSLSGFTVLPIDTLTLEVEVINQSSLNDLFFQLQQNGLTVMSMRTKANRLEELFIKLVSNHSLPRSANPMLGGRDKNQ